MLHSTKEKKVGEKYLSMQILYFPL